VKAVVKTFFIVYPSDEQVDENESAGRSGKPEFDSEHIVDADNRCQTVIREIYSHCITY